MTSCHLSGRINLGLVGTRVLNSKGFSNFERIFNQHSSKSSLRMDYERKKKKKRQLAEKETALTLEGVDIEDLFSEKEVKKIRESLLEWYDKNQRELPWRERSESDKEEEEEEKRAYGVWVSEVMLQQTRVQTVIDYYNRWMKKWPTIHDLAKASLEEVNEMWAGLGYYRRARFLLEGAKMIVAEGDGFLNTASALRKIPGIGNYTAGAIASIAFKEVVPVVDGNVIRVLARLKAISANPKDSLTVKKFWKLAAQLVDNCQPGDFNQSLMELGAVICTPLNPNCTSCPVSEQCRAFSMSKHDNSVVVTDYPMKVLKAKQRHDISTACVVEILRGKDESEGNQSGSVFILVKRPDEGLLAGLWEFPSVILDGEADLTTRREATDCFLKKSFNLDPRKNYSMVLRENVGEFVHIFSHIRLKVYVELLVLRLKGGMDEWFEKQDKGTLSWKCVDSETLSSMGLTSGVRKIKKQSSRTERPHNTEILGLNKICSVLQQRNREFNRVKPEKFHSLLLLLLHIVAALALLIATIFFGMLWKQIQDEVVQYPGTHKQSP